MNEAKLVLVATPLLVASILLGNSAQASIVKSIPARTHVALVSAQPIPESVTPNSSQESNPITDQLGCGCAYCVKAKSELQGKLPLLNNL